MATTKRSKVSSAKTARKTPAVKAKSSASPAKAAPAKAKAAAATSKVPAKAKAVPAKAVAVVKRVSKTEIVAPVLPPPVLPPVVAAPAPAPAARRKGGLPAMPVAIHHSLTLDLKAPPPKGAEHLPPKVAALLAVGQKVLGIKGLRTGQAEALACMLDGKDLLAVMPTGSGKSLIYQLPSLVSTGVTVVVSPLIALITDQVAKMVAKGVAAVRIDSTLTTRQRREVDEMVKSPGGKLLLTTPERMADPDFRAFLRESAGNVGVTRLVVDEAHCVSQWGHDFRPAYLSLRKALEDLGRPPVLATTATAPPHVREDILHQLGMEDAEVVTTTFDRPNLHYEVISFHDEDEKMKTLTTLLRKLPRPGIVYCATVKKVEELHEALARWNIPVAKYHGRLGKNERDAEQTRFMASKDIVMVATNAFGLGVDKQDIRNVIHYHVPGSLEAYAQEAGRGGRDGKPARCVLLFSPDDVAIQEYFLTGTYPTRRQVKQVFAALEAFGTRRKDDSEGSAPTIVNIAMSSAVGQQRTRTVLSLLKDEHFVVEREGGLFYIAEPPPDPALLNDKARQYEARRIADRQRLDALLGYVKAPGCRSQVILGYLGEDDAPRCGRCDNCLRSKEAAVAAATEASRLGASLTRVLDEEGRPEPDAQPRRVIRHRVVRIDAPAPAVIEAPAAPIELAADMRSGTPPLVRRAGGAPAAAIPAVPVLRRAKVEEEPVKPALAKATATKATPTPAKPGEDDEFEDDDDLDDDDDDLDDDDLEEDDDDLDDDDDDDDDDEEADDDFEVIDKTAAELAEEGVETSGEITILARKRQPKPPKQRPNRLASATTDPAEASAEARRNRRRRRRKRRQMLPSKEAFTTPVLSSAPPTDGMPVGVRNRGGGGGPLIEYVRGPMRIASAPVASANPNDSSSTRRRNGRRPRGPWRPDGPGGNGNGNRPMGPRNGNGGPMPPRFANPNHQPGNPNALAPQGAPGIPGEAGEGKRRRRRRRRKRGPGDPMNPNAGAPGSGPMSDAPISFFAPTGGGGPAAYNPPRPPFNPNHNQGGQPQAQGDQPIVLGPDGLPMRKRRRRRRRGRGGRGTGGPWQGGAEGAPANSDGGGDSGGGDDGGGDHGGDDGGDD